MFEDIYVFTFYALAFTIIFEILKEKNKILIDRDEAITAIEITQQTGRKRGKDI